MKRILLSLLVGFVFPFIYTLIVGPLTLYVENKTNEDLMGVPVRWPIMVLQRVVGFEGLGRFPFRDQDTMVLLTYDLICNVILYSALTYVLLSVFRKPKRSTSELPPQPPSFVSH